jgi:hypothetical protein
MVREKRGRQGRREEKKAREANNDAIGATNPLSCCVLVKSEGFLKIFLAKAHARAATRGSTRATRGEGMPT